MQKCKKYFFPAVSLLIALVSALFWVALRVNYSGISKFLGADTNQSFLIINLPVIVCVAAWLGVALALFGLAAKKRWASITGMVIGIIMTVGAAVVVYFGAWDYLSFIMVHFWKSLGVTACIGLFALVLFFPVKGHTKCKWALLGLVVVAAVVIGYALRPCSFTYGAVVYAVEDDYQIVFSTSDSAMAWVTIDGENYYDLYAGSSRSADKVHKITVPQSALDAAGGYTIHAQQMIYRGPFGGYKGEILSQDYDFRAVDSSDGLDYVSLSDVHGAADAAAKAATAGEDLDFLVLLGDLISMVETEEDAQYANYLAHKITGGTIPVIYARGNHEIKGEYGELLYKYVGSKNQSFSYTVTLGGSVFAVVLDMGEDHEDDWWEYYGTAQFETYRAEQTQMLQEAIDAGDYKNYSYRMAICHIPIVQIEKKGLFSEDRKEWTSLLNEMEMDISLSGHKHKIWYYLPGVHEPGELLQYSQGYGSTGNPNISVTDFTFPTFLVGQRSLKQNTSTQKWALTEYMCLHTHVDLTAGYQESRYITSFGDVVQVVYPFATDDPELQDPVEIIQTPLQ